MGYNDYQWKISVPAKFFAVTTGVEGIKLMKLLMPDIVFLDINMPGLSGFDCLKIIKSDNCISKIPIIIYSPDVDEVIFHSAIKNGAMTCLKKQGTIKDLAYLLNKFFVPDKLSDRMNYNAMPFV